MDPLHSFYELWNELWDHEPAKSSLYYYLKQFSIIEGFASEDLHQWKDHIKDYDDLSLE